MSAFDLHGIATPKLFTAVVPNAQCGLLADNARLLENQRHQIHQKEYDFLLHSRFFLDKYSTIRERIG